MARFGAPHGVHGRIRIHPFSRTPENLAAAPIWWCRRPQEEWRAQRVLHCQPQGKFWVAQLSELEDREAAQAWRHGEIALDRGHLPAPAADTFYWCDLIGLKVVNREGHPLGTVAHLMETGAHDVLVIKSETSGELLIPFAAAHIDEVSPSTGAITVDWQTDW